eukprot:11206072-Lingulodinium_polyedra.AAC.1
MCSGAIAEVRFSGACLARSCRPASRLRPQRATACCGSVSAVRCGRAARLERTARGGRRGCGRQRAGAVAAA